MSFVGFRTLARVLVLLSISAPSFAQISINEILAENKSLINPDGSVSDWVELYNGGSQPANVSGYSLTDNAAPGRGV